jgi:hypothetical protein
MALVWADTAGAALTVQEDSLDENKKGDVPMVYAITGNVLLLLKLW